MNKWTTVIFIIIISSILVGQVFLVDQSLSLSERRLLKEFPGFDLEKLLEGDLLQEYEEYLLDHMPLRDEFRYLKTMVEMNVFRKSDSNGYVKNEDGIFKLNEEYDPQMTDKFIDYVNRVSQEYFANNDIYVSVIPNKSYFLSSMTNHYSELFNDTFDNYIDIIPYLGIEDYYLTDPHWRQERIIDVANLLLQGMNKFPSLKLEDFKILAQEGFMGAYGAQSSFNVDPEVLYYLYQENMDEVIVRDVEDQSVTGIYDEEALVGMDPYEVYLSGASPLIEMINPNAKSQDELIIFRDSFASSIAPLFLNEYAKITLVDTRYMHAEYLNEFVTITDQDVLFLYSDMIIQRSNLLK